MTWIDSPISFTEVSLVSTISNKSSEDDDVYISIYTSENESVHSGTNVLSVASIQSVASRTSGYSGTSVQSETRGHSGTSVHSVTSGQSVISGQSNCSVQTTYSQSRDLKTVINHQESDATFKEKLAHWAISTNTPHAHLNQLLGLLIPYHNKLHKDVRSLLRMPRSTEVSDFDAGSFSYFGIASSLNVSGIQVKGTASKYICCWNHYLKEVINEIIIFSLYRELH